MTLKHEHQIMIILGMPKIKDARNIENQEYNLINSNLVNLLLCFLLRQLRYNKNTKMNNNKSISHVQNSLSASKTNAPLTVLSRPKFENVEKLTNLVRNIEQNSNRAVHPEQVVGAIKSTIRQNYTRLYENYQQNKTAILRSIIQTQANQVNDNQMRSRAENALRQKNIYDKLKAEVQATQKKLSKLREIRAQLEKKYKSEDNAIEVLEQKVENVKQFQATKDVLEYQTAVLEQMKKQRQNVKLILKQRHENMLEQQKSKKQRTQKVKEASHTKKILLERIQQKLKQEDVCQIPESLSEELQKKLLQVNGKYTQQQILRHEKLISQEKSRQAYKAYLQEQERIRKLKLSKQKEQLRQFDMMENHYLLKKAEQEQIKRYCRVQSLTDIADSNINEQQINLIVTKQRVEQEIKNIKDQNEQIREQIQTILTTKHTNNQSNRLSMLELEKQMDDQQTQLKRLRSHVNKKENTVLGWQAVLQGVLPNETSENLDGTKIISRLKMTLGKYQQYCKKQKLMEGCSTAPQTTDLKSIKSQFNKKAKSKPKKQTSPNKSSSMASDNCEN